MALPLIEQSAATEAPPKRPSTLHDIYRRTFEVVSADTAELQRAAYRLRYQVYCVENPFLPIDENPGGLERDEYDAHSVQAVLVHRPSGDIAGTIRLVLPRPGAGTGSLPIHRVCTAPLQPFDQLPIERMAELSRFAISKEFRRRAEDGLYGAFYETNAGSGDWRRVIPHISLGLISAALQFGTRHAMDFACAVVEPTLLRLLTRFGLHFTPMGPTVDYHGVRQPCYAKVTTLISRLERERHDVWEVVTDRGRYWPATLPAYHGPSAIPAREPA